MTGVKIDFEQVPHDSVSGPDIVSSGGFGPNRQAAFCAGKPALSPPPTRRKRWGGALPREEPPPDPPFQLLESLIRGQWRTAVRANTGSGSELSVQGDSGSYRLRARREQQTVGRKVH